jgi:hypothetical protein
MSQVEAVEKIRSGEIAATALIAGKPVRSMSKLTRRDGLHLVPIPYSTQLIGDYLPTTLTHNDYPDLVAPGEAVDTVAVGAVMITYNWPKTNPDRYRRIQTFVEAFFPKIAELQKPPRHPKWREVNLAATLPGWQRFEAAQAWLDNQHGELLRPSANNNDNGNNNEPVTAEQAAREAVATSGSGARPAGAAVQPQQRRVDPALYQEFLRWRQMRSR